MKILLVCSGGMSSAVAAKALQEAGAKEGLELEVHETSTQRFEEDVKQGYDLSLVAPQIRHRFEVLKPFADEAGIPILLIKPQGYSPIGGKFLLKQIKEETNLFN